MQPMQPPRSAVTRASAHSSASSRPYPSFTSLGSSPAAAAGGNNRFSSSSFSPQPQQYASMPSSPHVNHSSLVGNLAFRARSGAQSSLMNETDSHSSSAANSSRVLLSQGGSTQGGAEDKLASAQRVIRKLYRKSIELSSNLTLIVCYCLLSGCGAASARTHSSFGFVFRCSDNTLPSQRKLELCYLSQL